MRRLLMLTTVASLFVAVAAQPAAGYDKSCAKAHASQAHTFKTWIENAGTVAWRASMDVRARDRCNHGALTVTYSWQNGRIEDTGGMLKVTSIAYQTSSSKKWRTDGLTQGACAASARRGCIEIKDDGHLDLSPRTRIKLVRLTTALVYDPNPDDDSIADSKSFAPRTWTCDVRYPKCEKPKKRKTGSSKPQGGSQNDGNGGNNGSDTTTLLPPAPALPNANGGDSA